MKYIFFAVVILIHTLVNAQELYVSTEPASNMAKGSIGVRLNSKLFIMEHAGSQNSYRVEPEIMLGVNRHLMMHVAAYGSNMFQKNFRAEGGSLYAKYRFFSQDDIHEHFRLAAYGKYSFINNPQYLSTTEPHLVPDGNGGFIQHQVEVHLRSNDIDPDGNNSSLGFGVTATKLKNKFALSASAGFIKRLDNIKHKIEQYQPGSAITYNLSAGWLLLPKDYTSYRQTNFNVYMEALGQYYPGQSKYYVDVVPAIQFIFNSIARVDIAYRTQSAGTIERLSKRNLMVRLEYNLLNVF